MSHFKYEINERNLRLQLRENAVSLTDEAWQKFESFSATQKSHNHENVMKRFQVSLNRNVVLPVVFGGVIILFSLLLFNFVNIKNPNQETAEIKAAAVTSIPATPEKKTGPAPAKKEPAVIVKDTVIPAPAEEKTALQPEENTVVSAPEIQTEKKEEPVSANTIKNTPAFTRSERNSSDNNSSLKSETKKKKRNKRQLIVTEPTVDEDDQAPPPVSQASASSSDEAQ